MRIGIITSSYPTSPQDSTNAGVFVRDFARLLADGGHNVVVVSPHRVAQAPSEKFVCERIPWPGAERSLTHIDPRKPWNLVRLALMVLSGIITSLRVARRSRFDHVLAMWAVPSGLLALAVRLFLRTPYSVWALGSDIWKIRSYPLGTLLLRRVLRGAEELYADGHRLAEDVRRISGRPCTFLASSRIMPEPGTVKSPALDPKWVHLLCVARWHPHKGVDVLLDAVALLPEDVRARTRLHVYGGGPDEDALRAAAGRLEPTVRMYGYLERDDFMALLQTVTALIVPSRIESIPLILSDAAQARCPVVVTDVGDMAWLVREYQLGEVVPPDEPAALASALAEVVAGHVTCNSDGAARMVEDLSLARSVDRFTHDLAAECHPERA